MVLQWNIRQALISGTALCFLLAATGCTRQQETVELFSQELTENTTWKGTVLIHGDIYVPPGVTLTIEPGSTVKFKRIDEKSPQNMFAVDTPYYPEAELIIRGTLIARGNKRQKIIFTSAEVDARPGDWGAINFLGSNGNVVEHAKILFAYNGVHAHGSQATIRHNEFANCGVGISFKSEEETPGVPWFGLRSNLEIIDNVFYKNKGGIGFRNSSGVISHNEMRDNKFFGIWPKENSDVAITYNEISGNRKGIYLYQAKGVTINHNNIYDNKDYDIGVAEAQDFDVDATNNWFGTINAQKIEEKIFNKHDDDEIGDIRHTPFLEKRVEWELR